MLLKKKKAGASRSPTLKAKHRKVWQHRQHEAAGLGPWQAQICRALHCLFCNMLWSAER